MSRDHKSLTDASLYVRELIGVLLNPRVSLCWEDTWSSRKERLDFILALDGDVGDFFAGTVAAEPHGVLPIAVVVLISATSSDNNSVAVLNKEDGMQKICCSYLSMFSLFSSLNREDSYPPTPPGCLQCGGISSPTCWTPAPPTSGTTSVSAVCRGHY